jgi:dolichyl-phosphate-mannose--protein O-mannosyl transferase
VTGYPERVSAGSMWIVRGADFHCVQGTPLRKGARLRLQHGATQRWLHSHLFASPLSNQQEVSAFGSDAESDTGDVWTLEFDDKAAAHWARDMSVRLKHVDTGAFLVSSAASLVGQSKQKTSRKPTNQ